MRNYSMEQGYAGNGWMDGVAGGADLSWAEEVAKTSNVGSKIHTQ